MLAHFFSLSPACKAQVKSQVYFLFGVEHTELILGFVTSDTDIRSEAVHKGTFVGFEPGSRDIAEFFLTEAIFNERFAVLKDVLYSSLLFIILRNHFKDNCVK